VALGAVAPVLELVPEDDDVLGTAVGSSDGTGIGVTVAEEPQAKITASNNAKDPRITILGFLLQCFKIGWPPYQIRIMKY
jgi:hypothetical protein